MYASGGGSASKHRQPSNARSQTAPGSSVTISAKNGGVNGSNDGKKKKWSVSRLTSNRGRDSGEERILGGDAGPDGQPRIMKETTITVSKHLTPGGFGSQASSEDSREPIIALEGADLASPIAPDWQDGRARAGSSATEGIEDLERGIPLKPWNGRKVDFE